MSDSGVGVRPEDVPRLFERFHRIEGTRARTHEGSGIGLALVHDLVRLHGGTISARSTFGKGTTFILTIPKGSAHLPQDRVGSRPSRNMMPGRAATFVEEALRWLPDDEQPILQGRGCAGARASPSIFGDASTTRRGSSSPTTTPICVTTSRRLLGQHWTRRGRRRWPCRA